MEVVSTSARVFRQASDRLSLGQLAGLIVLDGLLTGLLALVIAQEPLSKPLLLATAITVPLLTLTLLWAGVTVWVYAVTHPFSDTGSLRETFKSTGYGLLPSLVSSLLALASVAAVGLTSEEPLTPALAQESALFVAAQAAGLSLVVFQWGLWTLGARYARNVSWRVAVVAGGAPAVVVFSLELSQMLTGSA
ncbi:YIP1 family protein [Halobaculum sp. MBLA0143]|uniref:YIP1 family protein n=1 Tax=Halobaculum sp. MBLA0143 TaxID=3079933 RepID=UPI003523D955